MSNGSSSHRGGCSYFSFFFSADLPTLWPRVQAAIIYNASSRPTLVPVRRNRNRNGRHMRNGLYITEDRDIMRRTTNSCIRMRRQCDDCLSFNYYLIASRLPTLAAIPRKRARTVPSRLLKIIIPIKRFATCEIVPWRVLNIHAFVYLSLRNSIERNGYTIFILARMER